jgi:hypothetical protein
MKKLLTLAIISLFIHIENASAKIWRVNNVPGISADFTTAQNAHDGATAGDTIYLESSPISYGSLTATKQLVWFSLGYFLTNNPGLQYQTNTGFIDGLTVNAGADGSVFQLTCNSGISINSCTRLTFQRCYVASIFQISGTSNNITITQCYFNFNNFLSITPSTPESTFTVINNMGNVNYVNINSNAYLVVFSNNTIFSSPNRFTIDNAAISNNIFYNAASGTLNDAGYPSNVTNNLWVSVTDTNYVGKSNNIFATTASTVFAGGSSPDAQYALAAGSPAMGTGAGGIDMGAFGGTAPYVVSLIPAIPSIYQLAVPANASGNTLPCTVSTKANN